jgi:hypothetical protein
MLAIVLEAIARFLLFFNNRHNRKIVETNTTTKRPSTTYTKISLRTIASVISCC